MIEIEKIFQANGASISQVFRGKGGAIGFRIPTYQRKFSWDQKHIERLFDDINEGLLSLRNDKEALTFIGTIILNEEKVLSFDGNSLSVVDGQQRLTTIILMSVALHRLINQRVKTFNHIENEVIRTFIDEHVNKVTKTLMFCFSGNYDSLSIEHSNFYPRLIRVEDDMWSTKKGQFEYVSPTPSYIHQYLKHVLTDDGENFKYIPKNNTPGLEIFERNLYTIESNLKSSRYYGGDESLFPDLSNILLNSKYRKTLFDSWKHNEQELSEALRGLGKTKNEFLILTYHSFFAQYFLSRLAVTKVIASDEKYAFEIFEALNTTGEPLTALETFKPIVSYYEDEYFKEDGGFSKRSKLIFDYMDCFMGNFRDSKKKQEESASLIVSFALYFDGSRESRNLSSQRRYLRDSYERLDNSKHRIKYIETIDLLREYKERFWIAENLEQQLLGVDERENLLFCLDFIREMKMSITLPVLLRYYSDFSQSGNILNFQIAVKAVTAFIVIWRSFFGGTAQIDNVFREIMQKGSKHLPNAKPLKLGKKFEYAMPEVHELKSYLRSYLKFKDIADEEKWKSGLLKQPLYSKSKVLCRFLLMMASHNTKIDLKTLELVKGRNGAFKDYMKIYEWRNQDYSTIEHVAPKKGKNTGWCSSIYSEAYLVDSIGNLALLPEKENTDVGNKSWKIKKHYFKVFSCSTLGEVEEAKVNAKKVGINFTNKTQKALKTGNCLPAIKLIAFYEDWTHEVINDRANNIGSICWKELFSWLS